MAKLTVKASTASRSEYIFIQDSTSTTGAGLTGLVYNSASLTAYYVTERGTPTSITLVTLASATAAYSSGGFVAVDATNMPGLYRFDLPSAVLSGNKGIVYLKGATNMVPVLLEYDVVAYDTQDTVRLGLTAMPNVASGSAGALVTSGTGTGQISLSAGAVTAGTVSDKTGYSLATAPPTAATIASEVWNSTVSGFTTNGTFGYLLLRSDAAAKQGLVTLHQVGGINRVDADVHAVVNDSAAGTNLKNLLIGPTEVTLYGGLTQTPTEAEIWSYGTRTLTSGGGGGGSTVALRMGPYTFSTPDTRAGEAISTMVGAAHAIEFQLLDTLGNAVDSTGATVTAKVYSLAGTLLDTYTATAIYDAAGRGYFTIDSTVTATAGTYRVTLTRSTGLTDTTVFGPVTLYVREV